MRSLVLAATFAGALLLGSCAAPYAQRDYDFKMVSLANPTQVKPVLQTPFDERNAEVSPDGRWMAYDSNESGLMQVYVRPFPNVAAAQYQVSIDGGRSPMWSPKGGELFFVSGTSMMRPPFRSTTSHPTTSSFL